MKRRKNSSLHVVADNEELTDAMIDELISELREEDDSVEDLEERIRKHKKHFRRKVCIITALIILLAVGSYLLIHLQTYTKARTVTTYSDKSSGNNNYEQFADGVLKYSRDGIAFLNRKGEEEWNQPYQIKNPVIEVYKESAAVADKGGNDIVVFSKDGIKGEIHTTLPIEKIAVSSQGIVSVILKNETSPKVVCYDAAGNLLAELKTSITGTGYPMDVSLSEDGEVLLVSYMGVQNGVVTTKINYYNFGKGSGDDADYQVTSDSYDDMIAPATFFMSKNISVAAGDDRILIYKGSDNPKLSKTVTLKKQIKSVFHSGRYIGLILKNEGKAGYELALYNTGGQKVMSEDFTGDYTNVKIDGSQVIMYDGKKCSVFTRNGIHKFEGELGSNIMEMFPVIGVNKYIVMNADGMEVVRFVK